MREAEMSTADENKTARAQQSQQVAQDAAEAYRAAVKTLNEQMAENKRATEALVALGVERGPAMRQLRADAIRLNMRARDLGIPRKHVAAALGVTRQTIHDWLNKAPR